MEIVGSVRELRGPGIERKPVDVWRYATLSVLFVGLLPVVVAGWLAALSFRFAFSLLGLGKPHVVGPPFLWPGHWFPKGLPTIPVYHYTVDCGSHVVSVRQEKEFINGSIFIGNQVRLRGRVRDGVFLVKSGTNQTLGTKLSYRMNPWKLGTLAAAALVGLELVLLLSAR